jgi:hypothetical protein
MWEHEKSALAEDNCGSQTPWNRTWRKTKFCKLVPLWGAWWRNRQHTQSVSDYVSFQISGYVTAQNGFPTCLQAQLGSLGPFFFWDPKFTQICSTHLTPYLCTSPFATQSVPLSTRHCNISHNKQFYMSSLLYRACCFNLFFIVPTHALHYTLKY